MELIQILLNVLILLVVLFLPYSKSYLKEKGKNLATKEDIQLVTQLVEKVKVSFSKDIEHLKANLSIIVNTQISLISEERNAVINFNKSYFDWYSGILNPPQRYFTSGCNEGIDQFSDIIEQKHSILRNNEAVFDLFVSAPELKILKGELVAKTMELLLPQLIELAYGTNNYNLKINFLKEKLKDPDLFHESSKNFDEIKVFHDKHTEIAKNFYAQILVVHKQILPLQVRFQNKCREHLFNLLQNE